MIKSYILFIRHIRKNLSHRLTKKYLAIKKAKILVTEMEEYKFGYNYLLYYLSAKKISDLLHTEIGKNY